MHATWIVYRKEMTEIIRDRRTLMAIGLAALATPIILSVISQVSTRTATQAYTIGYTGDVPAGLDILLQATNLKLVPVADLATAAKQQVDVAVGVKTREIDEYFDPRRASAQNARVRLQNVVGQYDAAPAAAPVKSKGNR